MIIRTAQKKDSQQIACLLALLGYPPAPSSIIEDQIERCTISGNSSVLVAEDESCVLGFISLGIIPMFHVAGYFGRITALCVHSQHRKKGIGKQLLAASESFFRSNGCMAIEVSSRNTEERRVAHRFYAATGFKEKNSILFRKELI